MHEEVRRASAVMCRSINAQAEFWMKIGMLAEASPTLSFNDIVKSQFAAAHVRFVDAAAAEMVKTSDELARMRVSGKLLASVFEMLDGRDLEGMSTLQINDIVEHFITVNLAARPASKGQYGFKFVLNCSINDVVCHGVPDDEVIVRNGDIINLDVTLEKNGFIADSSKTYLVGNVPPAAKRLVRVAQEAMWMGINQVRPDAHMGDIGFAIERHAKKNGYSVVREFCGHGIGREMHEEPQVLNFGRPGTGARLGKGMVFTIEPMVNPGTRRISTRDDGWTVVTNDQKLSAQFEHTVAVTSDGVEVRTLRRDEVPMLVRAA